MTKLTVLHLNAAIGVAKTSDIEAPCKWLLPDSVRVDFTDANTGETFSRLLRLAKEPPLPPDLPLRSD
jgi:hypothetical protein